ncbi:MAG: nucleotide exchange factor GrpE, partial [Synergistaceae bacterium]|nr:nucleotide exchange factor GrpE [Synergistaceae bacterium]
DIESYVKGVGMVRDQFFSVLEDLGVSAIETVGKPFDPSIHEAVAVEEAGEEIGDGIITEEVQRGYTISGKVLRAARVKVAKASR